ncbi:MAG: hypothetical protein JST69_02355 [Bacteroidetes bacterium]|nr:hypothetical protein [Bacteroidota bacterium]
MKPLMNLLFATISKPFAAVIGFLSIFYLAVGLRCSYHNSALNVTLFDKPLGVIKSYAQGKWKLQKVTGGLAGKTYPSTNNAYMIINEDHITIGDNTGIQVDMVIVWRRAKDIFNDSTYLLSYRAHRLYAFSFYLIVSSIQNNDLVLIDNAYDPFYYYYSRK